MVRNGSHQPPEVLTSAGAIEVTAPRVNDWAGALDGERPGRAIARQRPETGSLAGPPVVVSKPAASSSAAVVTSSSWVKLITGLGSGQRRDQVAGGVNAPVRGQVGQITADGGRGRIGPVHDLRAEYLYHRRPVPDQVAEHRPVGAAGMPSSSPITVTGSGNAKQATKSLSPATCSHACATICSTAGRSPCTRRAVKVAETRRRSRVCAGGSSVKMLVNSSRSDGLRASPGSRRRPAPAVRRVAATGTSAPHDLPALVFRRRLSATLAQVRL